MIYVGGVYVVIWMLLSALGYVFFLNYRMKENLSRFVSFWGMFVNGMAIFVFIVIFSVWPLTLFVMWLWEWSRYEPYEI